MDYHKRNWQIKRLEELCQFQNGYSFKNKDYQNQPSDGYVVFRMGNINRGGGLNRDASSVYITKDQSTKLKRFVLSKNDIVMCMTDMKASMNLLGHTALIDKGDYYILNQRVGRITVEKKNILDYRYLFYYTNSKTYLEHLRSVAHSGVQVNLSTQAIWESPILLPPLPIQQKIAAVLSAYDDLIKNNTRRIEILEEMAGTIYREWFVEFHFPGHEQVPMVESELGLIPQGWKVKKVKEIVKRLKAGQTYQQANVKDTGKIIVVDQSRADFLGFHDNEPDHNASPTDPIIIFGDHTCKMQLMITPFSLGPNVVPFIAKDEMPINYLFFGISNLVETREYKRHWTELNNKEVAIGDSETRKRFSDFATPIFEQIETLREKNQNLRQTRDLLLPKLISGEIDVSELDTDTNGVQPKKGGTHIPDPLKDRLHSDENILGGKPVIKGTRLAVAFILELLGHGWSEEQVLENYPGIEREDIAACLAYQQKVKGSD